MNKGKKLIAIDLVPLIPGQGGSGGGVWMYASSLVPALDKLEGKENQYIVFTNNTFSLKLKSIKVVKFPFFKKNIFYHLLWTHFVLPFVCLKYKIDILHKITPEIPVINFVKTVITVHDFMMDHYLEDKKYSSHLSIIQKLKALYFIGICRHALVKSEMIICVTQSIAKEAVDRYNVIQSRITNIYEGCDAKNGSTAINKKVTGAPKILYVAGFYPHKGHLHALFSFEYLLENYAFEKGYEPILIFRGHQNDKKYYNEVLRKSLKSKFKNNIIFQKYKKNVTLNEIYSEVSLVLQLSDYEGFGLPLIEAQYFKIPVVCSDIAVFREVMGDTAEFVDRNSKKDVAEKIYKILNNKKSSQQLIEKGKNNVKRFSWEKSAEETKNIYDILKN